jgi:hypothetical protein
MPPNFRLRRIALPRIGSIRMSEEVKDRRHRVDRSADSTFLAFWRGQIVYEDGRVKHFETEREAWDYLARCDVAGKIIH